jgi:hypothetical protein
MRLTASVEPILIETLKCSCRLVAVTPFESFVTTDKGAVSNCWPLHPTEPFPHPRLRMGSRNSRRTVQCLRLRISREACS